MKQIFGLAFLPVELVGDAWANICMDFEEENKYYWDPITKLNDYFTETYIDYSTARYPIDVWNNFELSDDRTNNPAESTNSRINSEIKKMEVDTIED